MKTLDNTPADLKDEAEAQAATEAVTEEIPDLLDDDLLSSTPDVEAVAIELPDGAQRKLHVKRLKGEAGLKALSDLATAKTNQDTSHLKLVRCVMNADGTPRFTDVTARNFLQRCDLPLLSSILGGVHRVNPLLR